MSTTQRTTMPIMGSSLLSEIPLAMLAPHEVHALRNHGQTLERLAERGGISTSEAIAILEDRSSRTVKHCIENERHLMNKVRQWSTLTIGQRVEDLFLHRFRGFAGLDDDGVLSPAERADIIDHTLSFEECSESREVLQAMNDTQLVNACYWVMADYVKGQG